MSNVVPAGDKIRELRIAKGLTQDKLAVMASVDKKTIYNAERGSTPIRAETLSDLAAALSVPVSELRFKPPMTSDDDPPLEEGANMLTLRAVSSARELWAMASRCEELAWDFDFDPNKETAQLLSGALDLLASAVQARKGAIIYDEFSDQPFPMIHRVAALKAKLDELERDQIRALAGVHAYWQMYEYEGVNRRHQAWILRIVFTQSPETRRIVQIDTGYAPTVDLEDIPF